MNKKLVALATTVMLVFSLFVPHFYGIALGATEEIMIQWQTYCPKDTYVTQTVPPGWKIVSVLYFDPGLDQNSASSQLVIDPDWYFMANHITTSGFPSLADNQGWTTISMCHRFFNGGAIMTVRYIIRHIAAKEDTVNQAVSAANFAATNAQNACNAANTAASRVWDSTESKSAATLAKEARDKANAALTEINNVKNAVTNIQASVGPQILRISGRNSATCTKTDFFDVVIQATGTTEFRVKADTGSWSGWVPINSKATANGISGIGAHTIYVEARNTNGVTATGQIAIFRI